MEACISPEVYPSNQLPKVIHVPVAGFRLHGEEYGALGGGLESLTLLFCGGGPSPGAVECVVERIVTVPVTQHVEVTVDKVVERIVRVPVQQIVEVAGAPDICFPTPTQESSRFCGSCDICMFIEFVGHNFARRIHAEKSVILYYYELFPPFFAAFISCTSSHIYPFLPLKLTNQAPLLNPTVWGPP